jgi:hypothetical protein
MVASMAAFADWPPSDSFVVHDETETWENAEFPRVSTLLALAAVNLLGGIGAAIGLARTPSHEDTGQVVFIALLALACLGVTATLYLFQRRREVEGEATLVWERAVELARRDARRLAREAQELSRLTESSDLAPAMAHAFSRAIRGEHFRWSSVSLMVDLYRRAEHAAAILARSDHFDEADQARGAADFFRALISDLPERETW